MNFECFYFFFFFFWNMAVYYTSVKNSVPVKNNQSLIYQLTEDIFALSIGGFIILNWLIITNNNNNNSDN